MGNHQTRENDDNNIHMTNEVRECEEAGCGQLENVALMTLEEGDYTMKAWKSGY